VAQFAPVLFAASDASSLSGGTPLPVAGTALRLKIPAADPFSLIAWPEANEEMLRHFQALLRIDTTSSTGSEIPAIEYIRQVFEAEGIPALVTANDPQHPNLIARIHGNGSKRPILLLAHVDTVQIDRAKWTHAPFGGERQGGYIYGRGASDDKWQVAAGIETLLLLKRNLDLGTIGLDRDVVFVAEATEETSTGTGIEHLVAHHWDDLDAEACIAEGDSVRRQAGRTLWAPVLVTEKLPTTARLVAHGPAGHGSRPSRNTAILHLAQALDRLSRWDPPVRLNDTTRRYFEKLAALSAHDDAERYRSLLNPAKAGSLREYFAVNDPGTSALLRTSVSANMIKGGYQVNVIPSEAEATLDIRALPGEDMTQFLQWMRQVINDPYVDLIPDHQHERPFTAASSLDSQLYKAIEAANTRIYNVPTIPTMSTGATDMAFLRAKGMHCYGVGPLGDVEDGAKGFGAHGDQERILEEGLYKFLQFQWDVLNTIAFAKH
jgi:acetylornithine deacetylase/succinyl-diaminopimelate desuccinylase-like protein